MDNAEKDPVVDLSTLKCREVVDLSTLKYREVVDLSTLKYREVVVKYLVDIGERERRARIFQPQILAREAFGVTGKFKLKLVAGSVERRARMKNYHTP